MLSQLGVILGFLGALIFFAVFWKASKGTDINGRITLSLFGFSSAIYANMIFSLVIIYELDLNVLGSSLFLMGIAFLFNNIGRSIPARIVGKVISENSRAMGLSLVHISLLEPNSIYVLLIAVLGLSLIRNDHMPYVVFNNASIYVSLGSMAAAFLMGIVMRKMLEKVETFEDMRKNMSRTILATVSVHSLAIIGMAMAILAFMPYME